MTKKEFITEARKRGVKYIKVKIMDILTDEEKKQMRQRIREAASFVGSPFLFCRFKKGDDYIIECKEVDADSIMYFCKGDSIFNAYKKQPKEELKKELDTLITDGWEQYPRE